MSPQASPITNLDIRCAELGGKLANVQNMEERILNAALAVLEEQGPYAMFLYIQARHHEVADQFKQHSADFLREVFRDGLSGDALEAAKKLAADLDNLLFARELLRNALSYARYHLKAKGS